MQAIGNFINCLRIITLIRQIYMYNFSYSAFSSLLSFCNPNSGFSSSSSSSLLYLEVSNLFHSHSLSLIPPSVRCINYVRLINMIACTQLTKHTHIYKHSYQVLILTAKVQVTTFFIITFNALI